MKRFLPKIEKIQESQESEKKYCRIEEEKKIIEEKNHEHNLIYNFTISDGCQKIMMFTCSDKDCGYWFDKEEYNTNNCSFDICFQNETTIYLQCAKCQKKTQEDA